MRTIGVGLIGTGFTTPNKFHCETIELANFLKAIADDAPAYPDFAAALRFERVIHAIARSAESGARVALECLV